MRSCAVNDFSSEFHNYHQHNATMANQWINLLQNNVWTTKWYATLQYDCTKKKKFWYKTFFFYKLHIGYACEIILISSLVSEAKLKCGVGGGARQYKKSGQVKKMDYGYV